MEYIEDAIREKIAAEIKYLELPNHFNQQNISFFFCEYLHLKVISLYDRQFNFRK